MAAALSGCGIFGSTPKAGCPHAAILDQAKSASYYKEGKGHDLTDVAFEVAIPSLAGTCEYAFDEGRAVVTSVLTIGVEAKRGPASAAESVEVPYFVAVVDPERHILAKQLFRPKLVFAKSGIRAQTVEEIEQVIPIAQQYIGEDYDILIGLQLDRVQLEENLTRKRR